MKIGIISDTHGLLRPEAAQVLRGTDHILHAGDVGEPGILDKLREIAPVTAIRGNVDRFGICGNLPATEAVELGGVLFYLVHDIADLDIDPSAAEIGAIVYGHSHRPDIQQQDGVFYLNPGSAGPRRFSLPVSVAIVEVAGGQLSARIVTLLETIDEIEKF